MAEDIDVLDRGVVPETGRVPADLFVPKAPQPDTTPPATAEPTPPPPVVTPRPVPEARPSMTERIGRRIIEEDLAGADATSDLARRYFDSVQRENEARTRQREATRPAREETLKLIEREEKFLAENRRQPPQALPQRPQLNYDLREIFGPNKAGSQFMQQIGVFASMSGQSTQQRLILALTAFNGMVEGWAQGKKDRFDAAYSAWKDEVANIRDTETRKRQYVNDVLNDAKTSLDLKAQKIELLGLQDGDAILAEQGAQKELLGADKFLTQRLNFLKEAMKAADDMDKHVATATDDHLWDLKAAQFFAGDVRSAMRGVYGRNVEKYTAALERYGIAHGMTPEQIGAAGVQAHNKVLAQETAVRTLSRAGPAAIAQMQRDVTSTRQAVDSYERLAKKQIDTWLAAGMKVDDFGSTVVNRWERWLKKEIAGDPDVFAFDLMSLSVRNEVQRVLTTARMTSILTVSAQQEGKDWMDHGMPKDTMFRVAATIHDEFANRTASLDEEQGIVNNAQDVMSRQLGITTPTPQFENPPSAPGAGALTPTYEFDPVSGTVQEVPRTPPPNTPTYEWDGNSLSPVR